MKIKLRLELLNLAFHKVGGRGRDEKNLRGSFHSVGITLGVQELLGKEVASAPDRSRAVPLNNYSKGNVLRRSESVGVAVRTAGTALMVGGERDRSVTGTCRAPMVRSSLKRALLTLDSLVIYPRSISLSSSFPLF